MIELTDQRSYTRKVFGLGDGRKNYKFHIAHKHYKDQRASFQEIDQTLQFNDLAKVWHHSSASYYPILPEYADDVFEFYNNYEGANHTIKAIPQAAHVKGAYFKGEDGNGVLYKDAFGKGVDLKVYAYWAGLKKVIIINEKPADTSKPLTFDFEMDLPKDKDGKELVKDKSDIAWSKTTSLDFKDKTLKIGATGKESYFRNAMVWDSGTLNQPVDIQLYVKNGKTYLRKTITPDVLEKAAYPLMTDHPTSYYAGAGDGVVYKRGASYDYDWDTTHDATTGTSAYPTATYLYCGFRWDDGLGRYSIYRAFFPIDTSGIDDGATISSAILYIYAQSVLDTDNDGQDYLQVVGETSQAATNTLATSDYDNCGSTQSPTIGSDTQDITSIGTVAYTPFTLNATGISWIKKTAGDPITMLGLREGHDIENAAGAQTDGYTEIQPYFSEQTGTSQDPYLDVTTEAASGWVRGGKLKNII